MRSYKSETILMYHFLDTIVQSVLLWFCYDSDNVYVNLWCFGDDVNILIKALSIILHYYITSDSKFYHCISSIVVLMKDSWWWNSITLGGSFYPSLGTKVHVAWLCSVNSSSCLCLINMYSLKFGLGELVCSSFCRRVWV